MTPPKKPAPPAPPPPNEKARLREIINELMERMLRALDNGSGGEPSEGHETATFGDICTALDKACGVYRLLNGTGDLDTGGSALAGYQEAFSGRKGRA